MNSTFRPGESIYNSCVGNNGNADLQTYSDGYHESALTILEKIDLNRCYLDLLIYPLVYSARHRIELLLKRQILILAKMKTVYDPTYSYRVIATHEISALWKDLKGLSLIDSRYLNVLNRCEPIINDFAEIDDNGEAFRYPFSNTGTRHLGDVHCIDVRNFKLHYLELNENLEHLESLTDLLYDEYRQKSVIDTLSRMQLSLIAKDLLPISKWKESEFDDNKRFIKDKFSIGSKTLSNAIKFIKNHREFSMLIGCEIRLPHVSEDALIWFFRIHSEFESKLSVNKYSEIIYEYIDLIRSRLSLECIASLAVLYDIGYFNLYSEEFDYGFDEKIKDDIQYLIRFYLLDNGIVKEKIALGLEATGQKTLIQALKYNAF